MDPAKRGKFLGLVQTGTTTAGGARTGIDHLKELGVTTVQSMPSFDFGSTVPHWGYDPVGYNVPEEQYSQFSAPDDRIREFKDMVDGFHRNGIRVVMDVVCNHPYDKNVFGGITGQYYTPTDLSATGNSIDDGNPMVSRMIRDSLEHWVRDYDVDGFRFDLAGVHRYSSVSAWASYLDTTYPDRNLLLYGAPRPTRRRPGRCATAPSRPSRRRTSASSTASTGTRSGAARTTTSWPTWAVRATPVPSPSACAAHRRTRRAPPSCPTCGARRSPTTPSRP
ncbi:alpha-amylase family glycosyl hydrolase [Kitasatospora sp. NPDC085895]|uniref:alpha-amylase family glycosyl hydrolase n=1 Tax=Kitasatospora sp. NPDC085895 TaxID=3155057 RepID=UPI00344EC2D8